MHIHKGIFRMAPVRQEKVLEIKMPLRYKIPQSQTIDLAVCMGRACGGRSCADVALDTMPVHACRRRFIGNCTIPIA